MAAMFKRKRLHEKEKLAQPLVIESPVEVKRSWPMWARVIVVPLVLVIATPIASAVGEAVKNSGTILLSDGFAAKYNARAPFNIDVGKQNTGGHKFGVPRVIRPGTPEGSGILDNKLPKDVVEIGSTTSDFVLTGTIAKDVTITDIYPVDVNIENAISGTYVYVPTGGQGGNDHETITFNLLAGKAMKAAGGSFFDGDPLTVPGASRIIVTLAVEDPPVGTTRWVYAVDVLSPDSKESTVYIDRRGKMFTDVTDINPDDRFSVTSQAETYQAIYSSDATNHIAYMPGVSVAPAQ